MASIPSVYGHIKQIPYREKNDAIICAKMTEYANMLRQEGSELVFLFDFCRESTVQKIDVNPISPDFIMGLHKHDYYEVNFCLDGVLYEYVEGEFMRLEKNQFILFNPNAFHSVYSPTSGNSFNILIDGEFFERFCDEMSEYSKSPLLNSVTKQSRYTIANIENLPEATALADKMFTQNSYKTYNSPSFELKLLECQFRAFMLHLLIAEKTGSLALLSKGNTTYQDKVTQILNYLRDNYATVTLSELSSRFGYSTTQMYRILIKYTGNSFSNLVDQYRFNQAAKLLRETDIPIQEIGESLGFEKAYFHRFFKRLGFCTPIQYRKHVQDAINAGAAKLEAASSGKADKSEKSG